MPPNLLTYTKLHESLVNFIFSKHPKDKHGNLPTAKKITYNKCLRCNKVYEKNTIEITDIKIYYIDGCEDLYQSDIEEMLKDPEYTEYNDDIDINNFHYKINKTTENLINHKDCLSHILFYSIMSDND